LDFGVELDLIQGDITAKPRHSWYEKLDAESAFDTEAPS